MSQKDKVTVLVLTSPIKSHPDTSIICHTIATCRFHFPDSRLVVLMDGVRAEQEEYRERYTEFKSRLRAKFAGDDKTEFVEFDKHMHQVGMTRFALNEVVKTPLIFFVEQDMPIVIDEP